MGMDREWHRDADLERCMDAEKDMNLGLHGMDGECKNSKKDRQRYAVSPFFVHRPRR